MSADISLSGESSRTHRYKWGGHVDQLLITGAVKLQTFFLLNQACSASPGLACCSHIKHEILPCSFQQFGSNQDVEMSHLQNGPCGLFLVVPVRTVAASETTDGAGDGLHGGAEGAPFFSTLIMS